MPSFFAYRRTRSRRKRDASDGVPRTLSPSSTSRHGQSPTMMKRVSNLLSLKRGKHRSRPQSQQAPPPAMGNKAGHRRQEPITPSSMFVGTSGSRAGQRSQNALGLYIMNPSSLRNMSSPQIAATPSSSILATPTTPLPKVPLLPDHVATSALQAELANAKSRITFMQQHWAPKTEIEERVRTLARGRAMTMQQHQHGRSISEEEGRIREKLERRIGQLENEVRILRAKVRPVASFVDLRPKPQRELPDASPTRAEGVSMSSHGSMNTIDHITSTLVDGVVNHDNMVRRNNTTTSHHANSESVSTTQHTFGRRWHARSNTFGHSSRGAVSHLEIPNKRTSGRQDVGRDLTSQSSRTPLLAPQPQLDDQQEKTRLAESSTSTLSDGDARDVISPTAEIEELLQRLSVDHSAFLPAIASRPPTVIVTSNIRERRQRARSSVYSSPSVYSEHFSLAQSRVSPSPTPSSNLQVVDPSVFECIQKSPAPNVEPTDPSLPTPSESAAKQDFAQNASLRLPSGDRSFVGYQLPSRPGSTSPTKSERPTFPELRIAPRRLRSSVALLDWTPPTEPQ